MELVSESLTAEMVAPDSGRVVRTPVEVRVDPLTGHTSRILPERGLMPPNEFDLESFAAETSANCPFCGDRLATLTPKLLPELAPEGRITRGQAILFPNLHAYSSHSCVSVYSAACHYLPLEAITEELMADNLLTQVAYARAVMGAAPTSQWASINANHMLPSGSSLFHPHLQGIVDAHPTTMQRMLAGVPAARFEAYLDAERDAGARYLSDTGRVQWLVSFAPVAPAELRAFIPGISSPAQCDDELVRELAHGLVLALHGYAEMGYQSFNLALYGAPPSQLGYQLNLRLACRSNLRPQYRSDSTFLERLHWEGAIDVAPESVAARLAPSFRS